MKIKTLTFKLCFRIRINTCPCKTKTNSTTSSNSSRINLTNITITMMMVIRMRWMGELRNPIWIRLTKTQRIVMSNRIKINRIYNLIIRYKPRMIIKHRSLWSSKISTSCKTCKTILLIMRSSPNRSSKKWWTRIRLTMTTMMKKVKVSTWLMGS